MSVFSFVKAGGKKFGSIVGVAPKVNKSKITKATDDVKLTALKARGQMKKQSQDFDAEINKVKSKLGQTMQKLKGEKVTKSGVSKGKDLIKRATGGRVGLKRGTGLMNKKSNINKIKKTFGTLSVRAGIDNNPNPTYADKIAGAKMKNKKKVV